MTSRDLGYDAPGQRFPPKFQPEPYAQDPVVIKHELEEKKKTIRSYLDLPPAQRLITLQKDIRDVQKDVRIYAQGFVETPYLHRALETLVAPATDAPGFDRPPKDDYNRDWRKLVRDLVAAHSPEPHLLGFGWEPSPEESECLRYMNLGDRRAGSTHWSCLREGKLVVRLRGAWNSIDHGWRLMVIDFKSGELEFIKKEYADLDTAELGIRHSTLNDLKAVVDTEADDAEPPSLDQRLMAATALSHSLPNIHEGKEKIFTGPASRSQGFSYTKHGLTFNPADRVQQKTDELGPLDVWKRSPEELEEMKKTLKKPKAAYEASPSDDKAIDIYNPPEYEPAEDISQNEFWRMYFSPQRMTEEFIETSKALDPRARRLLPTKPLSIETFYEMEDAIRLMPFHPDLFGGAFLPPFGIATLPGYCLSGPQRDLIFVAPPPPNVTIKYRIPEDLLSQLQAIKGLNFSLDQSFALQTRKLLKVMKPSHIRRLYLDVETTHPDGTVTKRVVGQRDLATADVEVDVRKITLSPRWLAACKSVFWPASMMAVATSVYTPYDGTHDLIHNLKPHETSPVTDVQEEIIHQTNETPARRLLHHLRHIPDLEEIDPVAARELELILSTPGVDIPLISLVEGEVSPFDLDQTHIDRQDPDSIRWRLYHPFT